MKLLITWLRKDGSCRSWTNGDLAEWICMSSIAFFEPIRLLAKEKGISYSEELDKIISIAKRNKVIEK